MRSLKIYFAVIAVFVAVYMIVQYNQPNITDWSPTYINSHKQPFGTYILYNQLTDLFPRSVIATRRQSAYTVLADSTYRNTAYMIVTPSLQLNDVDYQQITRYIKRGNDVYIAAENLGSFLSDSLHTEVNPYIGDFNKTEYIRFVNPLLNNEREYHVDKNSIEGYFTQLDTTKAIVLAMNNEGMSTLVKYTMGKGNLYLDANPKLFANYSLLKPQGAEYSGHALAYLNNPKKLIWDEYYTQGASDNNNTPLRVLLNDRSLKSAYLITVYGLLAFVLYGVKRRQRAIPIVTPLKNSTLDFVNVVGQVYYEQKDHQNIAHKKITYFLGELRDKYYLKTNKLDNELIATLAAKTGIDISFSKELIDYLNYINVQDKVTDSELIELNKLIEKFHQLQQT